MAQQAGRGPMHGLCDPAVPLSSIPSWSRGQEGWSSQHPATSVRLSSSPVSVRPLSDTCLSHAKRAAWDPSPHSRQETEARTGQTPALRGGWPVLGPMVGGAVCLVLASEGFSASSRVFASLSVSCLSLSVRVSVCRCPLSFCLFPYVFPSFYLSLTSCFSVPFGVPLSLLLSVLRVSGPLPWCFCPLLFR